MKRGVSIALVLAGMAGFPIRPALGQDTILMTASPECGGGGCFVPIGGHFSQTVSAACDSVVYTGAVGANMTYTKNGASCTVTFDPQCGQAGLYNFNYKAYSGGVVGGGIAELVVVGGCPPGNPGCVDTDGDGLSDDWETCGYNGVNLPAMGASKLHKDIFVEVDWMAAGPGESAPHEFTAAARDRAIAVFANAPVSNPDGIPGINLHIDVGQGGPFTGGNQIPHDMDLNPAYDEVMAIKGNPANFDPARGRIFHYCVFGHNCAGTTNGGQGVVGGSDFWITLGGWPNQATQKGAAFFVHELGHNLGLRHGGNEEINFKPNYLSVMNYLYAHDGLMYMGQRGMLDYSRWGPEDIPDLDESELIEVVGLDGPAELDPFGVYFPSDYGYCKQIYVPYANNPVDWNLDNSISTDPIEADIGGSANVTQLCLFDIGVLSSYDDWDNLVYTMPSGAKQRSGADAAVPEIPVEMTYEEYLEIAILPCDMDDSKYHDALDLSALIDLLFAGTAAPDPPFRADCNCDQQPDALDLAVLIDYLFAGGAYPCDQ